jgi:hypothetical protein
LSCLIRREANKSYLGPKDLLKSRDDALEYAINGEMNAEELKTWIKRGETQEQDVFPFRGENEIIESLKSRKHNLKQDMGLELIDDQLNTGSAGIVDLAGMQGTVLIAIEIESEAKAEDVGQLLGFIGELTIKRDNGQCTLYKAGKKAFDRKSQPIILRCSDVTGWLVAKNFTGSAFYAAYSQKITFWKISSDGNLRLSLDMKTATESDFEKFQTG